MGREPAQGQAMIYPGDDLIDLSKPLLTPWQLAPKFFAAGIEHTTTGYDPTPLFAESAFGGPLDYDPRSPKGPDLMEPFRAFKFWN